MPKLNHVSINSALGGMALGFEHVNPDVKTIMFYETNKACRYHLGVHWDSPVVCSVDELIGGVKRHVAKDEVSIVSARYRQGRDWSTIAKTIEAARPRAVVIEGMASLRSTGLVPVLQGLWALGYDAEGHVIPACTFGAKYKGERLWVVAHADPDGLEKGRVPASPEGGVGKQFVTDELVDEFRARSEGNGRASEGVLFDKPRVLRRDDPLSRKVDSTRVRFLSDDVSPVVAAFIGYCVTKGLEHGAKPVPLGDFASVENIHNAAKKHSFLDNTHALEAEGVEFAKKNGGVHLVVKTNSGKTIDYWPSTDVYIVRGTSIRGFGVQEVVSMCRSL